MLNFTYSPLNLIFICGLNLSPISFCENMVKILQTTVISTTTRTLWLFKREIKKFPNIKACSVAFGTITKYAYNILLFLFSYGTIALNIKNR